MGNRHVMRQIKTKQIKTIKTPAIVTRLLSNGTQHYPSGIQNIRVRTINAFTVSFLVVLGIVTMVRLFWGQFSNVAINSIAFVIVLCSQVLVARGKPNIAVAIVSVAITVTCYLLYALDRVSGIQIIPQLALCMVLSLMLFDRVSFRIGLLVFGLGLLTMVSLRANGDWALALIFTVQISAFSLLFLIYVYFFEAQDVAIQKSIKRLEDLNAEKNAAIRELNDRNEELVVLSHIMSHDLKSPLTSIMGYAELLEMEMQDGTFNQQSIESVAAISKASSAMSTLIMDLLTYSKISLAETTFERVELNGLVQQVAEAFEYQIKREDVQLHVSSLPVIMGNPDLLRTVFYNLISNAIKFQPKDQPAHRPSIRIWSEPAESDGRLFVADNGIGIERSYLPDLFKPFKRFHGNKAYSSTGLGMSICLSIVEKYNGTITLHDTSTSGTTFQLTFPWPDLDEPLDRKSTTGTNVKKKSDAKF